MPRAAHSLGLMYVHFVCPCVCVMYVWCWGCVRGGIILKGRAACGRQREYTVQCRTLLPPHWSPGLSVRRVISIVMTCSLAQCWPGCRERSAECRAAPSSFCDFWALCFLCVCPMIQPFYVALITYSSFLSCLFIVYINCYVYCLTLGYLI